MIIEQEKSCSGRILGPPDIHSDGKPLAADERQFLGDMGDRNMLAFWRSPIRCGRERAPDNRAPVNRAGVRIAGPWGKAASAAMEKNCGKTIALLIGYLNQRVCRKAAALE